MPYSVLRQYRKFSSFLHHIGSSSRILSAGFHRSAQGLQKVQENRETYTESGTWLHQLDDVQKMFYWGHKYGTRFGLLKIALNSKKPLAHDAVRESMGHWQRKFPVLQVQIKERDGDLWFYRPNQMDIDFKVYSVGTPVQEVIDDCFSGFDEENGPPWKARFLPMDGDAPCNDMEVKKDYPYQYNLYISPHHSSSDGRTYVSMIQPGLDIINDVIEGKVVDTNLPVGVFVPNEYKVADNLIRERLLKSPERLAKLRDIVTRSHKTPLLFRFLPRPDVSVPTTKHTFVKMDHEPTVKFMKKCKALGVTVGTGFQMITNTALVEMAQEAGISDAVYDLSANFTIDLRRYMQPRELAIHGCHAHTMASLITVSKDVRKNFWMNSQTLYAINLDLIRRGRVVKQAIGRQLFLQPLPPEDFFKSRPELSRDYAFNNLQSVGRVVHGRGKHVQITDLVGCNAVHRFIFPFMQMFYEYRGKYGAMFSWSTDCMTEDTVMVLSDRIKSLVEYYSKQ